MNAREDYPALAASAEWSMSVSVRSDSAAALDEIDRLRRQIEFMEAFSDGGGLALNGIPWREAFNHYDEDAISALATNLGLDPDMSVARLRADAAIAAETDRLIRIGRDIVARRNGRTEYALAGFIDELEAVIRQLDRDDIERCNCGYGGYHEPLNERCALNQRADA